MKNKQKAALRLLAALLALTLLAPPRAIAAPVRPAIRLWLCEVGIPKRDAVAP